MKADINVIDLDNLTIEYPEVVYDVPTGAKRWRQDVKGYNYTIIKGMITHKDNVPTHAYPVRARNHTHTYSLSLSLSVFVSCDVKPFAFHAVNGLVNCF
jgi:N-acyl-D-aspartate/D-glutamate deacylase